MSLHPAQENTHPWATGIQRKPWVLLNIKEQAEAWYLLQAKRAKRKTRSETANAEAVAQLPMPGVS